MNLLTGAIFTFALYTGISCFIQTRDQPLSRWMLGRVQNTCPFAENDTFCLNGGTSRAEKIYRQTICYCECPPEFVGERCEIRRKSDECKSCPRELDEKFCLNGGTCVEGDVGGQKYYYCNCPAEYWKEKCQMRSLPEMLPCTPDKAENFCMNGGTCYSQCFEDEEQYFCECPRDYTGLQCQHETPPEQACGPPYYFLLCLNGGTCSRLIWKYYLIYSCHCTVGYYGERCEHETKNARHRKCESETFCLNGGSCYALGSEIESAYFCECKDGYTGQICELKLEAYGELCSSPLQETFCRNGGTCYEGDINGVTVYYCQCRVGFWGARCEEQTVLRLECPDVLKQNLCHNGGTCLAITSNGQDMMYFCKCAEGFSGIDCQYSDQHWGTVSNCPSYMAKEYCLNNGTCYHDTISGISGYYCACPYPYHGERCELRFPTAYQCPDSIQKHLCTANADCLELTLKDFTIYYCDCKPGFYGIRCEHTSITTLGIGEMVCPASVDPGLCLNGGTCIQVITKKLHKLYFCNCLPGFFGLSCEYPYSPVHKIKCPSEIADTRCLNGGTCYISVEVLLPDYMCVCSSQFYGDRCEFKKAAKSELQDSLACPHHIAKSFCQNGGTCYVEFNNAGEPVYYCACVRPYHGERCEEKVHRRCAHLPTEINSTCPPSVAATKCQNGGTCIANVTNGETLHYCVCPTPFYGDECEFSTQISNYRSKRSTLQSCLPEMKGYCLNGGTCYMSDSLNQQLYHCECPFNFYGKRCEHYAHSYRARLPCPQDLDTNYCQNGGTCYVERGVSVPIFHCICSPPYIGKRCEQNLYHHPSDQCSAENIIKFCQNGGTCLAYTFTAETIYYCHCPYPFYGKTCELKYPESLDCPPELKTSLCLNGGLCVNAVSNGHYINWCQCPKNFYGARCEHEQSRKLHCPLHLNSILCQNGGSCVSFTDSEERQLFFCQCTEAFTGPSCEYSLPYSLTLPDACPPAIKATFCLNGGKCQVERFMDDLKYFCKCSYPYHGDRCELKFSAVTPCSQDVASCLCCNDGECSKITLDDCDIYYCACPEGFYGARCEHAYEARQECPRPFSTELCQNAGTCVSIITNGKQGIYFCKCVEGFYGMSCEYPYPALQLTCPLCPPYAARSRCLNGGKCCMDVVAGQPIYYCVCPEPYYGDKCDLKHSQELSCSLPFRQFFCLNGGLCFQRKSNGYNIHWCECKKGFYGARCEHVQNRTGNELLKCPPELKDLCKNGGTCVGIVSTAERDLFFCECPERFYGLYCENIHEPAPSDFAFVCPHDEIAPYCLHGGTCYFDAFQSLYYCTCPYPYAGQRCEYMLPEQSSCPQSFAKYLCLNGGICIYIRLIHYGIYFCKCPEGFYGSKCEYNSEATFKCPHPLDTHLCKNGGTCHGVTQTFSRHPIYFCKCLENFYGLSCEHQHVHETNKGKECPPEIEQHFCQNDGTCFVAQIEGIDVYYCECLNPYFGGRCELINPKAQSCPWILHQFLCLNGGTCTYLLDNTYECNIYYCECKEGYGGHRCENTIFPELDTEYCSQPGSDWFCLNGGTCFQEVIDGQNIYYCDCRKNFFGGRCQLVVKSAARPCSPEFIDVFCLNGGTCFETTVQDTTVPYCECPDGFVGERCEFKQPKVRDCCPDPIDRILCINGGSCYKVNIQHQDYFMCACQGHYFGPRCEYKPASTETCLPGLDEIFCLNGGTCYSFMFESVPVYYCQCPERHYGGRCEHAANNTLIEGLCSSEMADWFCMNGGTCFHIMMLNEPFYYCECPNQFTGTRCEHKLANNLVLCSLNVTEVFCRCGSECYERKTLGVTVHYCDCADGFRGMRCQYEKYKSSCPAILETEFCLNGATCHVFTYKDHIIYYCECTTEYYGLRCETPFPYTKNVAYPCEETIGANYCLNGGLCFETDYSDQKVNFCECPEGYNGLRCEYPDHQSIGVQHSGKESNCYPPHNETFCFNGGTCYQDEPGPDADKICICPANYLGPRCESSAAPLAYQCPQDIASDFCYNGGTCYQADHGPDTIYFCHCPEGYRGLRCEYAPGSNASQTQLCAPPLDENYCQNGGTCYQVDNGTDSYYFCQCPGEFSGPRCEHFPQKSQECVFPLDSTFCLHGGTCHQVVIPTGTVYFCECTPDFYGRQCEYKMPCAGPLIKRCDTEKEKDFCLNGGLCYESECRDKTVFACTCPEGYTGARCEYPPARRLGCPYPIDAYFCQNGGLCVTIQLEGHALFGCQCPKGYAGERCELDMSSKHEFCPTSFGEIFCHNGGICFQTLIMNEIVYYCECPEGYWGERCEIWGLLKLSCPRSLNTVLCVNGGVCYMVIWAGSDIYYCECAEGFAGTRCETEVTPGSLICLSESCQNGGTCYTKMAGRELTYACECPGGSWGEKCENLYSAIDTREIVTNYSNMQYILANSCCPVLERQAHLSQILLWVFVFSRFLVEITDCS